MKNIFYFKNLNSIGGVESFFYYIAKKYQDWDIIIYYSDGSIEQINRLKKYVKVKKYKGESIICDKVFFNYNLDIIDKVQADEYIQIIHADYKSMKLKPNLNPKITKYLGVSKNVCNSFKEITGKNIELAYNPIAIDEPVKVLNLISATRLTAEKGKNRIKKLAKLLDEAGIPYIWTIFTDDINAIKNPNIIYMKPRLDIINFIANSDYLVQLSDNEGYCYSVVEALSVGTPVIVTDIPVFKELGVNKNNGFILDFELSNVPIEKIYKGLADFKYKSKEDSWNKYLSIGESQYKKDLKTMVKVECIKDYFDLELNKSITKKDEPYIVSKARSEELIENEVAKLL